MIEIAIGRIEDFAFPMESGQILLLVPDGCSLLSEREYLDARDRYSDLGYELLYLSRLMQSIPEDLLMYYAPECDRRAICSVPSSVASKLRAFLICSSLATSTAS